MKRNLIFLATILMAVSFFFGCQKEEAIIPETETTEEGKIILDEKQYAFFQQEDAQETPTPFTTLDLENGIELEFYDLENNGSSGLMVLEISDCENCSALGIIEDTTATVLDYFWAYSRPGTAIPPQFATQNTKEEANIKLQQGWARQMLQTNELSSSKATRIACNNSSFRGSMAGGFLPGSTWVRYDKRPNNYSKFKRDCFNPAANGQCLTRYTFESGYYKTKNWRGKICARSVQTAYNNHYFLYCGPGCGSCSSNNYCEYNRPVQVQFQRWTGSYWDSLAWVNIPHNSTKTYSWIINWDKTRYYQLAVQYALPYDEFDFMMDKD